MPLPSLLLALAAAQQPAAVPLIGADAGAVRTPSRASAWGGERTAPVRVADYRIEAVLDQLGVTADVVEAVEGPRLTRLRLTLVDMETSALTATKSYSSVPSAN